LYQLNFLKTRFPQNPILIRWTEIS